MGLGRQILNKRCFVASRYKRIKKNGILETKIKTPNKKKDINGDK